MPYRRRRRALALRIRLPKFSAKTKRIIRLALLAIALIAISVSTSMYLRQLACDIAISDASDFVTYVINDTVSTRMAEGGYDYNYFVTFERDNKGSITALSTNVSRINEISSEILKEVMDISNKGEMDMNIAVGSLFRSSVLFGRGPKIPIKIIMLTTSHADLKNELVASGINQTRHQIILEIVIDVDVVMPGKTASERVIRDVLMAESIIVGPVPETYLNFDKAG